MLQAMSGRQCSRTGCSRGAAWTLTYDYADAMIAVGPLSPVADPHGYDLCELHSETLSAPHGWRVVRYRAPE